MSERDKEVLELLLTGKANYEIARHMGTSIQAVKNRLLNMSRRLLPNLRNDGPMNVRIKLAVFVHENRRALGVVCACDLN